MDFNDTAEMLEGLNREGFVFPDDYFVFDIETTGFGYSDLMVEAGWAVVKNREVVDNQGLILDWTRVASVDQGWLRAQLDRVRSQMAAQGRTFPYTYERLREEGIDPYEALHTYITLIYEYIVAEDLLVGHGNWAFDRRRLDKHTERFMDGYLLPWRQSSIFDTGLCEKASIMNRPPYSSETLDDWFRRISNARAKGVKWNLDTHCMQKYNLAETYGINPADAHQGWFDCRCIHYMFETFRNLAEALNEPT